MTKFLLTPFVAFFLMLLWAATIGDQVAYFMPGKNMFDEYLIICQIWFFGCVFKSLKNSVTKKTDINGKQ
tara:strand:+ start:64 stop:273 length:210 start_codon:yes stop_codon:yes gene_type:complete